MDVDRLIEEVRIRPALWDRTNMSDRSDITRIKQKMWKEVAQTLNVDVHQCKCKWVSIRDTYHTLVRRSERMMKRDQNLGIYESAEKYISPWRHFKAMSFVKGHRRKSSTNVSKKRRKSTNSTGDICDSQSLVGSSEIKIEEPIHIWDEGDIGDSDLDSEEFLSITSPEENNTLAAAVMLQPNAATKTLKMPETQNLPSMMSVKAKKDCHCSFTHRVNNVSFLQNLEQEERKLMKSTQQDMQCSREYIDDPDHRFLISFLPQMKKMNFLQNLQFRARMSEMVLNMLAPNMAANKTV